MAFLFIESENSSVLQNAANTLKVLLLLAGVIWTVLMVRGAFMSFSCEILLSSVVGFWTSIRCFLSSPLYICIIINSMVLLIAATSTFHHHHHPSPPPPEKCPTLIYEGTDNIIPMWRSELDQDPTGTEPDHEYEHDQENSSVAKAYIVSSSEETEANEKENDEEEEEEETMEATWEAIKTKQLKKSETFNEEPPLSTSTWKDLRKSETFNESVSIRRVGGLMRDPSIGIDEFNQQVEAFIKKFNQNMRLQRQESDQRFMDMMIKKGL